MSSRAAFSDGRDLFGVAEAFDRAGDAGLEFVGLGGELVIGELLHRLVVGIDLREDREQALDGAFIAGAKDLGECVIEQNENLSGYSDRESAQHSV